MCKYVNRVLSARLICLDARMNFVCTPSIQMQIMTITSICSHDDNYQYNGIKARERTFSSKQVKKLEGVVLNRVRVSNAQWLTYSQYRSSTPPPLPPRRGLGCRLISLWHCFSRQSAAVHQRLVRGCFKRNFFLYVKGNV